MKKHTANERDNSANNKIMRASPEKKSEIGPPCLSGAALCAGGEEAPDPEEAGTVSAAAKEEWAAPSDPAAGSLTSDTGEVSSTQPIG